MSAFQAPSSISGFSSLLTSQSPQTKFGPLNAPAQTGGINWQQLFSPQTKYEYSGGGAFRPVGIPGAPSLEQHQNAIMQDFLTQQRVGQESWNRNQQVADMFLGGTQAAANRFIDPRLSGESYFDQAMKFQEAGALQSKQAEDRLNQQMAAAQQKYVQDQMTAQGIYNKAIGTVQEGTDKVASDMAQAIARRKAADVDQIMGEMGAFPGTEAQTQEAARQKASSYDRELFGTVANIQQQAARDAAQLEAAKGNLFGSMANTGAQLAQSSAQLGFGAAQARNAWNESSSQIALAHGQFMQNANNAFNQATQMNLGSYANLIRSNPVFGILAEPTMFALSEAAKAYGRPGQMILPTSEGRDAFTGAPSYTYGSNQMRFA